MRTKNIFLILNLVLLSSILCVGQDTKADIEVISINLVRSEQYPDSSQALITLKLKTPEDMNSILLRYGTKDGYGDFAYMQLTLLNENNQYSLTDGSSRFIVQNDIVVVRTNGIQLVHWQQHDRYLKLTVKDASHKELKEISKAYYR